MRGEDLERRFTELGGGVRHSWSKGLLEKGELHCCTEEAKGGGVDEEVRLGKTSITGIGDGIAGELLQLTEAGDVIFGAKLGSKKI